MINAPFRPYVSQNRSVLTSDKILEEIKKNPKITANQIASILGITQRGVEKQLAPYVKKAIIRGWAQTANSPRTAVATELEITQHTHYMSIQST